MKASRISALIIVVALLVTACSKPEKTKPTVDDTADNDTVINLEVGPEPFESMSTSRYSYQYKKFESEQQMFDESDLVIVGMPVNTLTEDTRMYYSDDSPLLSESGEWNKACTVRDIKVLEILKGSDKDEIIKLIYRAGLVDEYMFGTAYFLGTPKDEPISKKNVKYIYYLKLDLDSGAKRYRVTGKESTINVDGLHAQTFNYLSGTIVSQVMWKYADIFEKYDRSAELAAK